MAFTYDISTTTGKIRLRLGDYQENDGILPGGKNFSDEELTHFYSEEGDHVYRAVALAMETAVSVWSAQPDSYKLGPESESQQTAAHFRQEAARLRLRYGHADTAAGPAAKIPASGALPVQVWPANDQGDVYGV